MVKYIDKFAVSEMLDRLEDEIKQYEPFTPRERAIYCRVHETGIMIALMRSEDVPPVRHGRWIDRPTGKRGVRYVIKNADAAERLKHSIRYSARTVG